MSYQLSPERKKEAIEKIAKFIVDNDFIDFADLFSQTVMPGSYALGQLGYMYAFQWVFLLFGAQGEAYIDWMRRDFREVMPAIMKRARELKEEREMLELRRKAERGETEKPSSRFERFKRWLKEKLY